MRTESVVADDRPGAAAGRSNDIVEGGGLRSNTTGGRGVWILRSSPPTTTATATATLMIAITSILIAAWSRPGQAVESGFEATSNPVSLIEKASVASLPPVGDHWLWVPDRLLGHSLLFDGDSGTVLGMIDSPLSLTPQAPIVATDRDEVYSVDLAYERGLRGRRTDFLTIYDLETLAYKDEIVFPTTAATGNTAIAYSARIGTRFVGVFNQFPATSVSILDLDRRRFVEEIGISGCSGIYPIDELRFATLCGNGTATVVELTKQGRKAGIIHGEKFFDTLEDPVFTAAGRIGTEWIFVSFAGNVHHVDFAGRAPVAKPAWSLLGDSAGDSSWRPGGLQLVAIHAASRRLFVIMHEGGPGSHKDAGPEIWTYDLVEKKRIARLESPPLAGTFLGGLLGLEADGLASLLLKWVLPQDRVHSIAVSQDATPLLFMRNSSLGAIGVVDAHDGAILRVLTEAGLAGPTLSVP